MYVYGCVRVCVTHRERNNKANLGHNPIRKRESTSARDIRSAASSCRIYAHASCECKEAGYGRASMYILEAASMLSAVALLSWWWETEICEEERGNASVIGEMAT